MENSVSPGLTTYCPEVTVGRLGAALLRSTTRAPPEPVLEQPVSRAPMASAITRSLKPDQSLRCRMTVCPTRAPLMVPKIENTERNAIMLQL
ncbi:hypothetical protein D3C73_1393220 [compost metagenome]